jgi:hypothetical protein
MSAMPPSTVAGRARGVDRKIPQRRQRIDLVLRRLQRHRIVDAVLLVEPEGGGHLDRAGQIDHEAVGHIGGRHAGVARARAVDVHIKRRQRSRLLDARIGHAADMAHLREQLIGVGVVRGQIAAADLQVNRRRRAKIEDLADDIGRQ